MKKLIEIFDGIGSPQEKGDDVIFSAVRLEGKTPRHICKDTNDRPLLLLALRKDLYEAKMPNYSLEYLRIEHNLRCRIVDQEGKLSEDNFTLLRCLSSDRSIQEYFLRVVEMLFETLPDDIKISDITGAVEKLVSLFSLMRQPTKKSVQGLWAELFFMVTAKDPLTMLKAWNDTTTDEMDFSLGRERIELKSSTDGSRRHFFSLDQLNPPQGTTQLVASIFTESSGGGKSIKELWDELREVASGDVELLYKIEKICAGTLGAGWQSGTDQRFDESRARESLLFFYPSQIPQVASDLPDGVSEVRFRSDLERTTPINPTDVEDQGLLFSARLSFG